MGGRELYDKIIGNRVKEWEKRLLSRFSPQGKTCEKAGHRWR